MEASGRVDGNGRTPLFFTFSPGMVVVYGRKRGRKHGVVLVADEDYHAFVQQPVQQFRRRDAVSTGNHIGGNRATMFLSVAFD
uniref:Uncharacterized protein n=1 Tax=Oryza sativa subsp. japonica TaxID=39947 RepID=Q2R270_ORYSJ|nr:hypothetical protein LOC_Os11g36800 [Oryza sativa Japonica Group]